MGRGTVGHSETQIFCRAHHQSKVVCKHPIRALVLKLSAQWDTYIPKLIPLRDSALDLGMRPKSRNTTANAYVLVYFPSDARIDVNCCHRTADSSFSLSPIVVVTNAHSIRRSNR